MAKACPLNCKHGTKCLPGNQDITGHIVGINGGPLDIHAELNRGGWHCDCPTGWTGLECDRPFESCDDGTHVCYNNGKCLPGLKDVFGNNHMYCDCTNAIVEGPYNRTSGKSSVVQYIGKYCEHAVNDKVEECDDGLNTCLHGGTCKVLASKQEPCDCLPGYTGKFCEFVEETVPNCEQNCLHGGACRLGSGSAPTPDPLDLGDNPNLSNMAIARNVQYCECPASHYGNHCEHPAELCGNHYCYHGSKCFSYPLADGKREYSCNCAVAYTESTYYAGKYCQFPSTSFCTDKDDLNGRQFCVNGGTCPTEPHMPCDCPVGFTGPRCATKLTDEEQDKDYSECDLECENDGICHKGVKESTGAFGQYSNNVEHLAGDVDPTKEHCVCPKGFFGKLCQYKVEKCTKGEHFCFHGSTCMDHEDGGYYCDCSTSEEQTAGFMCEFLATEECTERSVLPDDGHRGFCTNGGMCFVDEEGAMRCRCPEGYEGPHCEYILESELPMEYSDSADSDQASGGKIWAILYCGVAASLVAMGCVMVARCYKRKRAPIKRKWEIDMSKEEETVDFSESGGTVTLSKTTKRSKRRDPLLNDGLMVVAQGAPYRDQKLPEVEIL